MNEHLLVIDSLDDAQAHCICQRWFYSFTGKQTIEQIWQWYMKHIIRAIGG